MSPWLLIPVKSLRNGKSRLAPVLNGHERAALNYRLFEHILVVAHVYPGIGHTAIVSDSDDVLALAERFGSLPIRQRGPGMNAAVAEGVETLARSGGDILILPSDLPEVRASDIRQFAAFDPRHRISLCADRRERGTNGILLRSGAGLDFAFGEDSFAIHWQRAWDAGANPGQFDNSNIAFDIDVPADLEVWRQRNSRAGAGRAMTAAGS